MNDDSPNGTVFAVEQFRALPRHERLGERGVPVSRDVTTAAYLYEGRHQYVVPGHPYVTYVNGKRVDR